MNRFVLSGLVFAMALGTAQAEPLTLSAEQMDQVTASGNGRGWLTNNQVIRAAISRQFQGILVFGLRPSEAEATNRKTLEILDTFGRGG